LQQDGVASFSERKFPVYLIENTLKRWNMAEIGMDTDRRRGDLNLYGSAASEPVNARNWPSDFLSPEYLSRAGMRYRLSPGNKL
jgi:hypothetical protein